MGERTGGIRVRMAGGEEGVAVVVPEGGEGGGVGAAGGEERVEETVDFGGAAFGVGEGADGVVQDVENAADGAAGLDERAGGVDGFEGGEEGGGGL